MKRFLLFSLIATVAACNDPHPDRLHLRILGKGSEAESLATAAQITQRYLEQKRFVRVALPNVENPTEAQVTQALSAAVVQPAYGPGPNDIAIACTIREPISAAAHAMAARCDRELREIARELGVQLSAREL